MAGKEFLSLANSIIIFTDSAVTLGPLELTQSETMRAISLFFQMQFFSNIACDSFGAEILGGGGGTWGKRKEKTSQLHKAFPWKSPGSGGGQDL